jgi:hypothetical protein
MSASIASCAPFGLEPLREPEEIFLADRFSTTATARWTVLSSRQQSRVGAALVQRSVRACQGPRPRRAIRALALTCPSVLPSDLDTPSAPGKRFFRAPLPTLRPALAVTCVLLGAWTGCGPSCRCTNHHCCNLLALAAEPLRARKSEGFQGREQTCPNCASGKSQAGHSVL